MLNETGPPQFTDTTGWPESRIRAALEKTLKKIESDNTTVVARSWWKAFEDENRDRLGLVLRLAEELETRKATINDLFRCHLDSGTDNIQATLFYLDYQRLKKSHEQGKQDAAKASRPESNAECVDEADEAFIRCPDCQSLIPLNGGRCQMCENQWP
jgi:hypothetical protein